MPHDKSVAHRAVRQLQREIKQLGPALFVDPGQVLAALCAGISRRLETPGEDPEPITPTGPSCVAALYKQGQLHVGHVGTCRAYLRRKGRIVLLTRDHSKAQEAVDRTEISGREARQHNGYSVPTRWLGMKGEAGRLELRDAPVPISVGDRLILATDGIHAHLDEGQLTKLSSQHEDPDGLLGVLLKEAMERWSESEHAALLIGAASERVRRLEAKLPTSGEVPPQPEDSEQPGADEAAALKPGEILLAPITRRSIQNHPEFFLDEEEEEASDDDTAAPDESDVSPQEPDWNEPGQWPPPGRSKLRLTLVIGVGLAAIAGLLFLVLHFANPEEGSTTGTPDAGSGKPETADVQAKEPIAPPEARIDVTRLGSSSEKESPGSTDPHSSAKSMADDCSQALKRAVEDASDPCHAEWQIEQSAVKRVCLEINVEQAAVLWQEKKESLADECKTFKQARERKARCLIGIRRVKNKPVVTPGQCWEVREMMPALEGDCGREVIPEEFRAEKQRVGDDCAKAFVNACQEKIKELNEELSLVESLAETGRPMEKKCGELRTHMGELKGSRGVCNPTEHQDVPGGVYSQFGQAVKRLDSACGTEIK